MQDNETLFPIGVEENGPFVALEPLTHPAFVIGAVENLVIYEDDAGALFYYAGSLISFPLGTVADANGLHPVASAPDAVRQKILHWQEAST